MESVVNLNLKFDSVDPVIPKLIIKTMMGESSDLIKGEAKKHQNILQEIEHSLNQLTEKKLSTEEKNKISHRGKAWNKFIKFLKENN